MSFSYSPKILTDGLVLYLDAANTRSYSSTSTVWSDLSKSGNTGTLVNGPTFSSANGGSIVFDGIDDYVLIPNNIVFRTSPFTIDIWFKLNGNQTLNAGLINVDADAAIGNWQLSFFNNTQLRFFYKGVGADVDGLNLTTNFSSNIWYNVVITRTSNYDIISYVNALENASVNFNLDYNYVQGLRIGRNRGGTVYFKGNVASCKIYNNKSLSSSEILQNYNVNKTRFGL